MKKYTTNESNNYIAETSIPGLLVIKRPMFTDDRGFFREIFHLDHLQRASGVDFKPIQTNHSMSKPQVIRAIHAEGWNKLIYPVAGKMFAALVDIRPDSPTFAKVEEFEFDETDPKALFVPNGIANSICVIGNQPVHYIYLVDKYYDGSDTKAIAWDDPDLNINWPVKNPIISDRDKNNSTLRELFPYKFKKHK